MNFFKYPKERVSVQLRSPPGGFTSEALEDSRITLRRKQLDVVDGPRCKLCGHKKSWAGHCRILLEFNHHFMPTRIQS